MASWISTSPASARWPRASGRRERLVRRFLPEELPWTFSWMPSARRPTWRPRYSDGTVKFAWDLNPRHRLVALGVVGVDDAPFPRPPRWRTRARSMGLEHPRVAPLAWTGRRLVRRRHVQYHPLFMGTGFQEDLWETSSDINLVEKDSREGP